MLLYEKALKESGFVELFKYTPADTSNIKHSSDNLKERKRKIIWFNPPYSANVKTNFGKIFLQLIKRHFPKGHKFANIFNKIPSKLATAARETSTP